MTAIHAQTERKRLDGSVRRAEKHHRRARTRRFRGLIRAVSAACSTTAAAQGGKRLSGGRIQAIFTSDGTPLGECRLRILMFFVAFLIGMIGSFSVFFLSLWAMSGMPFPEFLIYITHNNPKDRKHLEEGDCQSTNVNVCS